MGEIAGGFFVEPADPARDRSAIVGLRERVFRAELGAGDEVLWDADDPHCGHVLAREDGGQAIGCGRLAANGGIGRLAVQRDWRGRGVGSALLVSLIDLARQRRMPQVHLHSEPEARPFYLRHGFATTGEVLEEAGILHHTLRLDLKDSPPLYRSAPPRGAESEEIELDGLAACRDALGVLLHDARRQLYIHTRALERELFSGEPLMQEVRRIATAGRGAEIRILVQDPDTALHDGAPLLALAQRLSSSLLLRQPMEEVESPFAGAYVLNDAGGLLFRPIGSRFEGCFQRHAPGRHRQLMEHFRQAWDRASAAGSLRAQSL
ncbi:GNAT family N-acetyltransferase [Pseudomarimonas salicorniae]|uniref:GNAT family N-acetyltransferase n=1 Tax=Pseudomarimonas salicorniae TaxID=2933270 RepID=A0ABT0GJS3_9GAMM|nr:GNAT family N-acetyltransferase [Lysobacter sp. CAU 1642]MCK7594796.1 GNAT family N-acetyltransferase [Lysobacter sp. CAU 1642]